MLTSCLLAVALRVRDEDEDDDDDGTVNVKNNALICGHWSMINYTK